MRLNELSWIQQIAVVALIATALLSPVFASEPAMVTGDFAYTADALHNASGGLDTGSSLLHNASAIFDIDLDHWFNSDGNALRAYILWNDHSTFSDRYTGDTQVVSNIDAIGALRLFELWYEKQWSEVFSLRFGLYNLNSEFDAIDTAALFLNSSHGIGKEYSQTGVSGPSIFPSTSLAARLNWNINDRTALRYALLDGVPGDPNDPSATHIDLGGSDGFLHAVELNYSFADGVRLGVGGFLYTANFNRIVPPSIPAFNPPRDDNNGGVYLFADTPIYVGDAQQVSAFARIGRAEQNLNAIKTYIGAGIVTTGLLAQRPQDQFGIAIASARLGSHIRRFDNLNSHETALELTYSTQLNHWLKIQPDIQYIINPGANPSLDNALVFGIRFQTTGQRKFN